MRTVEIDTDVESILRFSDIKFAAILTVEGVDDPDRLTIKGMVNGETNIIIVKLLDSFNDLASETTWCVAFSDSIKLIAKFFVGAILRNHINKRGWLAISITKSGFLTERLRLIAA